MGRRGAQGQPRVRAAEGSAAAGSPTADAAEKRQQPAAAAAAAAGPHLVPQVARAIRHLPAQAARTLRHLPAQLAGALRYALRPGLALGWHALRRLSGARSGTRLRLLHPNWAGCRRRCAAGRSTGTHGRRRRRSDGCSRLLRLPGAHSAVQPEGRVVMVGGGGEGRTDGWMPACGTSHAHTSPPAASRVPTCRCRSGARYRTASGSRAPGWSARPWRCRWKSR